MDILEGSEAHFHGWTNYTCIESALEEWNERSYPSNLTFETYRLLESGLGHLVEFLVPQSQDWNLPFAQLRKLKRHINNLLHGLSFWVAEWQPVCSPGCQQEAYGSKYLDGCATARTRDPSSDSLLPSGNLSGHETAPKVLDVAGRRTVRTLPSETGGPEELSLAPAKVDIYPQFHDNCARRARTYHHLLWDTRTHDLCSQENSSAMHSSLIPIEVDQVASHFTHVFNRNLSQEHLDLSKSISSYSQIRATSFEDASEEPIYDDLETEAEARVLLANMLSAHGWQFRPIPLSNGPSEQNTFAGFDGKMRTSINMAREGPQASKGSSLVPPCGVTKLYRPKAPGINEGSASRYRPDHLLMIKENRHLVSRWLSCAQQVSDS